MPLIPLAFLLVMFGGMGLTAVEAYDGLGVGLIAVGLCGTIGTAGIATQS